MSDDCDACRIPPKVLVACPATPSKDYSMQKWLNYVNDIGYPNYSVMVAVNGTADESAEVKNMAVSILAQAQTMKPAMNVLWFTKKEGTHPLVLVTMAREEIRRFAVREGYDYIFFLDSDTIPLIENPISKLMSWNKDFVSGLYFYKESAVPVAIDYETKTNFSIQKLREHAIHEKLVDSVAVIGFGCLLLSKDIFTSYPFDQKRFGQEVGEDYGYCWQMHLDKKKRYLDPMCMCKHLGKGDTTLSSWMHYTGDEA